MVAATALKIWCRDHLQWHDLPTKFRKNIPVVSEVDRGERHREMIDYELISIFFLL
jgi:hypothetical protein